MPQIDLDALAIALDEIDRALLAARIMFARQRKFPNATTASEALEERQGASKSTRSYQTHESGYRQPKLRELTRYAQMFDVPLEYFVFGNHPEISDADIEAQARLIRRRGWYKPRTKQKDGDSAERSPMQSVALITRDKSVTSAAPVNQIPQQLETNPIHNLGVRFIPVLSASEIRQNIKGRGGLAIMSGQKLPVPQFLSASEHSFSYQIPDDDLSMISTAGASFGPGTFIVVDRDAVILPGKYVLVVLEGFDEPLFRIYKAAKPYAPGVPFALHALNAAYDLITVNDAARVESIQRVIYTAFAV